MEHKRQRAVALTNTPENPLSERVIVEATLDFANGATLEIEGLSARGPHSSVGDKEIEQQIKALKFLREVGPLRYRELVVEPPSSDPASTVKGYADKIRADVRSAISLSLQNPKAVARELVKARVLEGIRLKAGISATSDGLRLSYYYQFATFVDLVHLGLALLLDSEEGSEKSFVSASSAIAVDSFLRSSLQ